MKKLASMGAKLAGRRTGQGHSRRSGTAAECGSVNNRFVRCERGAGPGPGAGADRRRRLRRGARAYGALNMAVKYEFVGGGSCVTNSVEYIFINTGGKGNIILLPNI